jgi:hypothetical protein
MVAAGPDVRARVLLVAGEHEYPEFRPDQDALSAALGGPARQVMVTGMDNALASDAAAAAAANHGITDWLTGHFI